MLWPRAALSGTSGSVVRAAAADIARLDGDESGVDNDRIGNRGAVFTAGPGTHTRPAGRSPGGRARFGLESSAIPLVVNLTEHLVDFGHELLTRNGVR